MNREQKRMLQRQGQLGADGEPVARRREPAAAPTVKHTRTSPRQFVHEINVELRKVAWPTRPETINYSAVVLITLIVVMTVIFCLDYIFAKGAIFLFK
jgi:preprotein translocase subunit SecE